MARRKGTLNRMELRDQADAAERQQDDTAEDEEEGDEDEDEEEGDEAEEEAEDEAEDDDEAEDLDEDGEPRPKKKKAKKKPAKVEKPRATRSRARSAKVVRQRIVWGVFNNSNQRVAVFDYPKKAEAEAQAVKLSTDKKSTFFVQPVKEPIEEKKEKE
jgi:cobalamin biosynthesis protein CobT